MERADLERLDRDTLIARAEAAGVTRARILTRPELVDELLIRGPSVDDTQKTRARGFFGRARDLLAKVIERGLHLPDAAERIRGAMLPPSHRSAPAALPTVTLAEIYAAQGHRDRATETLRHVLEREPDHAAARALLRQLEDATYSVPKPALPPEDDEVPVEPPAAIAATVEERGVDGDVCHDVDECVAIPIDQVSVFVHWELRERALDRTRAMHPDGGAVLRIVAIAPSWDGPRSTTRDQDVNGALGDVVVRDLSPGSVVRVAVGWRVGDSFLPFVHSPALETPVGAPSPLDPEILVRWTPAGALPVRMTDPDAASIARALGAMNGVASRASSTR